MDVRTPDAILQATPVAFDGVGVVDTYAPFFALVANLPVVVRKSAQITELPRFVGADLATPNHVAIDHLVNTTAGGIWDNLSVNRAAALDDAKDDGFMVASITATALFGPVLATDYRFHRPLHGPEGLVCR